MARAMAELEAEMMGRLASASAAADRSVSAAQVILLEERGMAAQATAQPLPHQSFD